LFSGGGAFNKNELIPFCRRAENEGEKKIVKTNLFLSRIRSAHSRVREKPEIRATKESLKTRQ